jgi:hypothetical protein
VLPVAFALVRLYQMRQKRVKPGLPDLVWAAPGAVYVILQIAEKAFVKGKSGGVSDVTSNLTLPFRALVPGVYRDLVKSSWTHLGLYDYNLIEFIALAIIIVAALLVIRAAKVSLEEKAAFVGFVLVEIVLASGQFWDSTFGDGRTYIDAFLLGVLMLLATPAGTVTSAVTGAAGAAAGTVASAVTGTAGAAAGTVGDAAVRARTTMLGRVFAADRVMTSKRLGWLMVIPVIVLVLVARRHILHQ